MADIYVDPTAASNGSGSFASPRNIWPTSIGASDRILLKRGTRLTSASQLSLGAGSTNTITHYGDATAPRPIITITATNNGSMNVAVAGPHLFDGIHFDSVLNGSANGAVVMLGQVSGGRAASATFMGCRFSTTAYNAIRANGTNTATAADTVRILCCEFDDIGEDCFFGGVLNLEVGWCRMTRMSSRTTTGDGIGFINADPTLVWIHDNYIDHSATDTKQCVIVDSSTGAGLAIIEDNHFIGYGPSPSLHTTVLVDCDMILRRNIIETYGLAAIAGTAASRIKSNLFIVRGMTGPVVSITGEGSEVENNTLVAVGTMPGTYPGVAMANGLTNATKVRNNLFSGLPVGIKSDSAGNNPTVGGNAYWGVTSKRLDASSAAFAEASEVTADPLLSSAYRPRPGSPLLTGGVDLGYLRDIDGRQCRRHIGAFGAGRFLIAPTA